MSEHDESATPEQRDAGFAEGEKTLPDVDPAGRFSEGQEELPDSPEKHVKERFSEGQEQLPDSPEKHHEGSFAEGQETIDPTHGPG